MIAEELPYSLPVILQWLLFYFQVSDQIGQEIKLNTSALQSNTDTDILLSIDLLVKGYREKIRNTFCVLFYSRKSLPVYKLFTEDPESCHDERSR